MELMPYDPEETRQIVAGNQLKLLGRYMEQMAAIVAMLRKEVDTLQKNAQQVTVSHQQALQLQRLMRNRAEEICAEYDLDPAKHAAAIRSAIKRQLLDIEGISDLHDMPLANRDPAAVWIKSWHSYSTVMKRRRMDLKNVKG